MNNHEKIDNTYATAYKLHTLGYSVIPSGGGEKCKAPLVEWKKYQESPPSEADLDGWQKDLKPKLWGMVTGWLSGLVVLDADTAEAARLMETELGPPHVVTPRGFAHWYFRHPGQKVKTVARLLPGLDIRGDGGFVNIAGSSGLGEYQIRVLPTPDTLIPWAKLPQRVKAALNGSKPAPDESSQRVSGIHI